jgi:serine protease AprX
MNPAKLHPSLASAMSAKGVDESLMRVILLMRPGDATRGEVSALSQGHPRTQFRLLAAQAVAVTAEIVAALTDDPAVDLIWADLPVHTWLDEAVPLIRAPRVWESGFTGRGVRIGVIDTGIDPSHPDLVGRVVAYKDFVAPDTPDAAGMQDPNGHGTHVAGIAAGSGAASGGRYRGVAPDADLVIARVLDASGNGRTSTVMAGIEWAIMQGAQVVNISLGGPPYPADGTDAFGQLCNAAVAQGVIVCAAAGNLGPSGHTIGSPAAATDVITVGATVSNPALPTDEVAAFSSRGPTGDGRAKPDVVFPGVGIVGPRAAGTSLGTMVDDHYTALSGTSQATPIASGTAALLLQANPRIGPTEIKSRLRRGAHLIPDVDALAQGAGRGDAYNTFIAAEGAPLDTTSPTPPPPPSGPPTPPPTESRSGCLPAAATGFIVH